MLNTITLPPRLIKQCFDLNKYNCICSVRFHINFRDNKKKLSWGLSKTSSAKYYCIENSDGSVKNKCYCTEVIVYRPKTTSTTYHHNTLVKKGGYITSLKFIWKRTEHIQLYLFKSKHCVINRGGRVMMLSLVCIQWLPCNNICFWPIRLNFQYNNTWQN
jgi:hypothetical protein